MMKINSHPLYQRYNIETKTAHPIVPRPPKFRVKVNRWELAKLLTKEVIKYRGNTEVILSRPCVYGVFSGPVGGFAPREELCVGCLRCTTQYPEIVDILHNPEYSNLGDSYFTAEYANTVLQEAENGRIPIRGAGFRGPFGGRGWDGMWTDMSEIVRPTRDGIHGREYISTQVDMGATFPSLNINHQGEPIGGIPKVVSIPIPILFDVPPLSLQSNRDFCRILHAAATELQSFSMVPVSMIHQFSLRGPHTIPLFKENSNESLNFEPALFALEKWNEQVYQDLSLRYPQAVAILRTDFESDLLSYYRKGVRIFHLTANYHGQGKDGTFVLNLIRDAHKQFVEAKVRGEVSLIGSGGIIAAEHVPKAIICGLDAVAINTPLIIALQGRFKGDCITQESSVFELPSRLTVAWGKQRLKNLMGAWRDQLLEILGAMGLREVRRMRGELGRALFQKELENEAFGAIKGYLK